MNDYFFIREATCFVNSKGWIMHVNWLPMETKIATEFMNAELCYE